MHITEQQHLWPQEETETACCCLGVLSSESTSAVMRLPAAVHQLSRTSLERLKLSRCSSSSSNAESGPSSRPAKSSAWFAGGMPALGRRAGQLLGRKVTAAGWGVHS
jgi:hypothetical protein